MVEYYNAQVLALYVVTHEYSIPYSPCRGALIATVQYKSVF